MPRLMIYLLMSERRPEDLQQDVIEFARAVDAPEGSFLLRRFSLRDAEGLQSIIDGLTLALISYCYHRHPRGENVHEIMEKLEAVEPGSEAAAELEGRADDAAALQIPFIVTINRLLEEYYHLRHALEARLNS